MNPICKIVTAWGHAQRGGCRPIKAWGFRCPDCPKYGVVTSYSGQSHTRKGAKNLYFLHRRKEHAGTG